MLPSDLLRCQGRPDDRACWSGRLVADTGNQASQEMSIRAFALCCSGGVRTFSVVRCPIYRDESFDLCAADIFPEREHLHSHCIDVAHGC